MPPGGDARGATARWRVAWLGKGLRQSIHARRGIEKVFGWSYGLHVIAYNLVRAGSFLSPTMAAA